VRRALAVLAALGMVTIAVLVRNGLDDDDGGDGGDGNGASSVVVCATDLASACQELDDSVEVRIEDPAVTAAALAEGSLADDVDAWVATTAWLEVAESRAPGSLGEPRALATSPAVVATAPGRYEAISDLCDGEDIWQCLGEAAGSDWGSLGDGSHADWHELKVGLTDGDLAVGLPGLASASAGFFGTTDFATNDPRWDDFAAWFANLAAPSANGDPDAAKTLATRQGTYSAAGSIGAIADQYEGRGVDSIAPEVPVAATVAIVEIEGGDGAPEADGIRDTLVDAGWARADKDDLAPTLNPGVMAALHSLWRDVTK
jgi:hypothetical protein